MRRRLPPAVLAILGSTMPALAQDVMARENNSIEFVRHLGPRLVTNAKELNELELGLINTQQAVPPPANSALGHGTAPPLQQVDNIRWNVLLLEGYPVCAAIQYHARRVRATFDIFPACFNYNLSCNVHGIRQINLFSGTPTLLWPWRPKETPHPQCSLISWHQ